MGDAAEWAQRGAGRPRHRGPRLAWPRGELLGLERLPRGGPPMHMLRSTKWEWPPAGTRLSISNTQEARDRPAGSSTPVADSSMLRVARAVLAATALAFIVLPVYVSVRRIGYPFELEWMEGGVLQHVERVLEGRMLYVPPSLEFTPFIYTPLYYFVSAPLVAIMGSSFLPMRLVSALAAVVVCVLIYRLVLRDARSRLAAFVAVGLFAATFRHSGAWLDLARVDSLFLAFLVGSVYLIRRYPSPRGAIAAGALLGLSFLTKQFAAVVAVPLLGWLVLTHIRRATAFAGGVLAIVGPVVTVFQVMSHGWFGYYAFELPPHHAWAHAELTRFWTADLLFALPIGILLAVTCCLLRDRGRSDPGFWVSFLLGMVGSSYLARLHSGGYDNVLLPAYAGIAVAAGLGLASIPAQKWWPNSLRGGVEVTTVLLVLVQFALLIYDPRSQVPSRSDLDAGRYVVERLRGAAGEIYVPFHGYLSAMAGRPPYAHAQAVADVWKGGPGDRGRQILFPALAREFGRQRFSAVVIDEDWFKPDGFTDAYTPAARVFDDPNSFRPVTGMPFRPEWIWLPKPRK